ncbi:hypothetical protein OV090_09660 [Nannocystis sp. RBIL2]|uniref:hypothetical protein n=1 Tax=Nannocystis sp. RBIL2 TaxID=2996788 RepID=UPI00226DB0BD|nr:hypothetical protein [Nannocystis sp. RBIL2]MCY1065026.1 hypothetical protein [Nannocystis sp. RBIL2]
MTFVYQGIARIIMAGLGCAAIITACGEADGDSSASEASPDSEGSTASGSPTTSEPDSTSGTGDPDAPEDPTGGPTATGSTSDPASTTGTSGTGDPVDTTADTTGTSGTGDTTDTTESTTSSTTGDEDTEDGPCADLAALQTIAAEKGGQAQCPGWTGIMTFSGDCPEPDQGWHAEKVFPGAMGEFGKYCYYQWIDGQNSEWDLCGLPPDGVRASSEWLGPDCNF